MFEEEGGVEQTRSWKTRVVLEFSLRIDSKERGGGFKESETPIRKSMEGSDCYQELAIPRQSYNIRVAWCFWRLTRSRGQCDIGAHRQAAAPSPRIPKFLIAAKQKTD